ncbi:MAG: hypothetical protein HZB26_07990 [Candidatus Hydrogenedentes bacterium]|nr:hypothetical protein [Candidatus Hydrogenedentota bacterium]
MRQLSRFLEALLGVLFVGAAILKALDMDAFTVQVSLYGVLRDPSLIRTAAWGALCVETALGIALLTGVRLRGVTIALTLLMLLAFTGLIAYAWRYHGLADCGCFGKYAPMAPGPSIGKNILMMLMAVVAAVGTRREASEQSPKHWFMNPSATARCAAAALTVVAVAATAQFSSSSATQPGSQTAKPPQGVEANFKDAPFARFKFDADGRSYDLGRGEYFVAMLSATCDVCMGSVPAINGLMQVPDLPPIVAIMLGDQSELSRFRAQTNPMFPTVLTQDAIQTRLDSVGITLAFMQFIEGEPPRFFLVRDGKSIQDWNHALPGAEAIQQARAQANPTKPAQ